jgi:hypothetical protein
MPKGRNQPLSNPINNILAIGTTIRNKDAHGRSYHLKSAVMGL